MDQSYAYLAVFARARAVIYLELSKPMEESIVNERIDAQLPKF